MPFESLSRGASGAARPQTQVAHDVPAHAVSPANDDEPIPLPADDAGHTVENLAVASGTGSIDVADLSEVRDLAHQDADVDVDAVHEISEGELDLRVSAALARVGDPSMNLREFARAILSPLPAESEAAVVGERASLTIYVPGHTGGATEQLFAGTIGSYADERFTFDPVLATMTPDLASMRSIGVNEGDVRTLDLPRTAYPAMRATLLEAYREKVSRIALVQRETLSRHAMGSSAMAVQMIDQQMARFNEVGQREIARCGELVWDVPLDMNLIASRRWSESDDQYYYAHDFREQSTQLVVADSAPAALGSYLQLVEHLRTTESVSVIYGESDETYDADDADDRDGEGSGDEGHAITRTAAIVGQGDAGDAHAPQPMSMRDAVRSLLSGNAVADTGPTVVTVRAFTRIIAPTEEIAIEVAHLVASERLFDQIDEQRFVPVNVVAYQPQEAEPDGEESQSPRG